MREISILSLSSAFAWITTVFISHLPAKQKLVLQAIAKERVARNVTSSAFIKKYSLASSSSVQSAIKGLMKNELLTQDDGNYRVYDYFLPIGWLRSIDKQPNLL